MSEQNFNYENRFKVIFNSEEYNILTKNIVGIQLPGITIGNLIQPTPIKNIYIPGDSIEFSDITIMFLLDEDYSNYRNFFLWLNTLRNFDEVDLTRDVIDMSITLLNGKYNPFLSIDLKDCYPYDLSEIELDYQISTADPIKFSVTFKINGIIIR